MESENVFISEFKMEYFFKIDLKQKFLFFKVYWKNIYSFSIACLTINFFKKNTVYIQNRYVSTRVWFQLNINFQLSEIKLGLFLC